MILEVRSDQMMLSGHGLIRNTIEADVTNIPNMKRTDPLNTHDINLAYQPGLSPCPIN